jgi:hypothetical protein
MREARQRQRFFETSDVATKVHVEPLSKTLLRLGSWHRDAGGRSISTSYWRPWTQSKKPRCRFSTTKMVPL